MIVREQVFLHGNYSCRRFNCNCTGGCFLLYLHWCPDMYPSPFFLRTFVFKLVDAIGTLVIIFWLLASLQHCLVLHILFLSVWDWLGASDRVWNVPMPHLPGTNNSQNHKLFSWPSYTIHNIYQRTKVC